MDCSPSSVSTASCDGSVDLRLVPTCDLLGEIKRRHGRLSRKLEKRVILLGGPGSGKGTQSALVKDKFNLAHLSTGDMLREEVAANTELGMQVRETLDKGELVSDEVVLSLVRDRISGSRNGFILDGFPRNVTQAIALDKLKVVKEDPIDAVIFLNAPDSVLIERVSGRRVHSESGRIYHVKFNPPKIEGIDNVTGDPLTHRKDDKPETIQNRLNVFNRETLPLVEYYEQRGILHIVNASLASRDVTSTIMAILGDVNYGICN